MFWHLWSTQLKTSFSPPQLPVPMFLPVTIDSAERIVETIQEIKQKIPSDPYEAELILMAEMVAEQEEKNDKQEAAKDKVVGKGTARAEAPAPDGKPHVCEHQYQEQFCSRLCLFQTTSVTTVTTWIRTTWPVFSTTGGSPPLTQTSGRPVDRPPQRSSTP